MKHLGKILQLEDPDLKGYGLFDGEVEVTEKLDGSFFRAGCEDGVTFYGSKNVVFGVTNPLNKDFAKGVDNATPIVEAYSKEFTKDWMMACEYLASPRQNALSYSRVPKLNLCLLEVWREGLGWMSYRDKQAFAERFGLEITPLLKQGVFRNKDDLVDLLDGDSFLGGCKREGFVVKNLNKKMAWGGKEQIVMAKFVRPEFKELNAEKWGVGVSLEDKFCSTFPRRARFDKVIQHLKDEGKLKGVDSDLQFLMPELMKDLGVECKKPLMTFLWKEHQRDFINTLRRNFPEYYKAKIRGASEEELGAFFKVEGVKEVPAEKEEVV